MKTIAFQTARWSFSLLLVLLVLLALVIGVFRITLPFVGSYRGEVQEYVSNYLGTPVELGSLDLSWHQYGPRLQLDDVLLQPDKGSDSAVHLERIYLDLNLLTLLTRGDLHINHIILEGVKLSVEYLGEKKLRVYGFKIDGNKQRDEKGLDVLSWLLKADHVALLKSRVKFEDAQKDFFLDIRELNIRAENIGEEHSIRVDVKIPELSAKPIEFAADFTGDRKNIESSEGHFTFNLSDTDTQYLSPLIGDAPVKIKGLGDIKLWGSWKDKQVDKLRVISELETPQIENTSNHTVLTLPTLSADVSMVRKDEELVISLNHFTETVDNKALNIGQGRLSWFGGLDNRWRAYLTGRAIELGDVSQYINLAEGIGAFEKLVKYYQGINPQGAIHNWQLWVDKKKGFPEISGTAKLIDVSSSHYMKIPEVGGVSGQLTMQANRGLFEVNTENVNVAFPYLMDTDIKLEHLEGNLQFAFSNEGFIAKSDNIFAKNKDFKGEAQFEIEKIIGDDHLRLDLKGFVPFVDASTVKQYYPTHIMKPSLVKWLNESIKSGRITNGKFAIKGPSKGFPYANGEGEFLSEFDITDGEIQFMQDWPKIDEIAAHVKFNGPSISVDLNSGRSMGAELSKTNLQIKNTKKAIIEVQGMAQGSVPSFLNYVRRSPLQDSIGAVLAESKGQGKLKLKLNLSHQLYSEGKEPQKNLPEFDGKLYFSRVRWDSSMYQLGLSEMTGSLNFSQDSLSAKSITAHYMGEPINISATHHSRKPDVFSDILVKGSVRAKQVLQNYKIPIDHWFVGKAPWELRVRLSREKEKNGSMGVSLLASSRLKGTVVDLPLPFEKIAITEKDVTISAKFKASQKSTVWKFSYDDVLTGRVEVDKASSEATSLQFGFNDDVKSKAHHPDGISLSGSLPALSFDGWITEISEVINKLPESKEKKKITPINGNIDVSYLKVGKQSVGTSRIALRSYASQLQMTMYSKWLKADVFYPREWTDDNSVRVNIKRLDKRFLDALATAGGTSTESLDPRVLPPISFNIESLVWDDINISDLRFSSETMDYGLRIEDLSLEHKYLQMQGSAKWRFIDSKDNAASHRSDIQFTINSSDVGKGINGLGLKDTFDEGRGSMQVTLGWNNALYSPPLGRLKGKIDFELLDGSLLAVEPGAAKIIGLFALQALPKRLQLDFKDQSDGLKYDKISGSMTLSNGIAETTSMLFEGPIGVITSSGITDYLSETYSQRVVVLPRVSVALPILGYLTAGPAGGVGVVVVNELLKGMGIDFDQIGRQDYYLTGSWSKPKLDKIEMPKSEAIGGDR